MSKLTVSPLLNTPLSVFCSHFALVESAIASMLLNSMVNSLPLAYVTTQESNVVYQPILLETLFQDLRSAPCLSQWPLLFHLLFWFFSFPRSLSMGWELLGLSPLMSALSTCLMGWSHPVSWLYIPSICWQLPNSCLWAFPLNSSCMLVIPTWISNMHLGLNTLNKETPNLPTTILLLSHLIEWQFYILFF